MAVSASEITTSVSHHDEIAVLSVVGEINGASAVLADDPPALIIDLSSVIFSAPRAFGSWRRPTRR
jgi:anti-anti-sigma regulatory factor